jgi:glycosyltransferase involved in cell wall biosynthesis
LRICRLVWSFPRAEKISYGLGPNFYYISKEQVKQGYEVYVVARRRGGEPAYEEIDGIKVHRVTPPYNMNAMRELYRLHTTEPFNIVHAHGTCGLSYPLLRFKIQRPLVVHAHGTALGMALSKFTPPPTLSIRDFSRSRIRESIGIVRQKLYWQHADLLIAVSHFLKHEIEKLYGINNSKIEVAYNGVDASVFKRTRDSQEFKRRLGLEDKRVILYVGHFGFRKGILYLVEAMNTILREEPDAFLLCVGGTPEWLGTDIYWKTLSKRLKDANIQAHAKLMGQVPHRQLPLYYSMADVFAFPSLYEAMGKVVVEAMACETPVVASRVGGIVEIINDGVNGLLVQPRDTKSLSQSILTILQDGQLARRLSERGRETVESMFTWSHTAMQISKAYQKLISSRS